MRRKKPISVEVKAPSRGLVSRLPGESADLIPPTNGLVQASIFLPSTMTRASAVASNVRYEDGVVCNAPGYQRVIVSSSILTDLIAIWHMDEVQVPGQKFDSSGNSHTLSFTVGSAAEIFVGAEPGLFNSAALFESVPFGSGGFSPYLYNADSALTALANGSFTISLSLLSKTLGSVYVPENIIYCPDYYVTLNSNGTLTFSIKDSTTSTITSITTSSPIQSGWNYIVVGYDVTNKVMSLFLNGVTSSTVFVHAR